MTVEPIGLAVAFGQIDRLEALLGLVVVGAAVCEDEVVLLAEEREAALEVDDLLATGIDDFEVREEREDLFLGGVGFAVWGDDVIGGAKADANARPLERQRRQSLSDTKLCCRFISDRTVCYWAIKYIELLSCMNR
jgi:hypothetical protein